MESASDFFVYALYALNIGATAFFLHKVLWLVRHRQLQNILIQEAASSLNAKQARNVENFDRFAEEVWKETEGALGAFSLGDYVARIDEVFRDVRRSLRTSRSPVQTLVMEAATSTADRETSGTALSFPYARTGAVNEITWQLTVPPLLAKRRLDPKLYVLQTKSRYGFWRKALVFFAGIADVVYSVQHVAVMSHSAHAPRSVLLRRLSLVGLLVALIMGDLIFGFRKGISALIEREFAAPQFLSLGQIGAFLNQHFATLLGAVIWTASLSLIYFFCVVLVRRHSRLWGKRLRAMKEAEDKELSIIYQEREEELLGWLKSYAASLDQAVDLGAKHAELLVSYHRGRLHRRVATTSPLDIARTISAALLSELPDAKGDVRDRATSERRSFRHYVWPREEEMRLEVELAQVRSAWQDIEHSLGRLSSERPDPEAIDGLFRRLIVYASVFRDLLSETVSEDLREGYREAVHLLIRETQADLDDLDQRLGEIASRLREQLSVASSLVKFQVEMTNHKIETSVNKLISEVIATRERARIEAMAFEI